MKYLLILLAILVGAWVWRSKRVQPAEPAAPTANPALQDMVRCQQCDLHLPAHEAVRTNDGIFCSEAHARVAGQRR